MPNLSTVNHDAMLFMLKGEPGTRKSTQALSFPGPQFWFSTDKKMEALKLPAKAWGIDESTIDYEDFNTFDQIKTRLKAFQINCKYETLIVDSITTLGQTINTQTIDQKTLGKGKDGGKGPQLVGGIPVNSLDDYKAEFAAFRDTLRLLLDIRQYHKINIVLIAHVVGERAKDEIATTHQSRIIITGGKTISGVIASYCTEVYHFDIKLSADLDQEGKYGLLTVHTGADFARTSIGLARRIDFGNKPLYATYIQPAIERMNRTKPISKPKENNK